MKIKNSTVAFIAFSAITLVVTASTAATADDTGPAPTAKAPSERSAITNSGVSPSASAPSAGGMPGKAFFVSSASGAAIDVPAAQVRNPLQEWDQNGTPAQQIAIKSQGQDRNGQDQYELVNAIGNLCLDGGDGNGVSLATCSGKLSQLWSLKLQGDGTVSMQSEGTHNYVGGNDVKGSALRQVADESKAIHWRLNTDVALNGEPHEIKGWTAPRYSSDCPDGTFTEFEAPGDARTNPVYQNIGQTQVYLPSESTRETDHSYYELTLSYGNPSMPGNSKIGQIRYYCTFTPTYG